MTYCQVFEFGRLFPKLQLSQEGLLKVCVFLQKVCMLLGMLVFQPGDDLSSSIPHFETFIPLMGRLSEQIVQAFKTRKVRLLTNEMMITRIKISLFIIQFA